MLQTNKLRFLQIFAKHSNVDFSQYNKHTNITYKHGQFVHVHTRCCISSTSLHWSSRTICLR